MHFLFLFPSIISLPSFFQNLTLINDCFVGLVGFWNIMFDFVLGICFCFCFSCSFSFIKIKKVVRFSLHCPKTGPLRFIKIIKINIYFFHFIASILGHLMFLLQCLGCQIINTIKDLPPLPKQPCKIEAAKLLYNYVDMAN